MRVHSPRSAAVWVFVVLGAFLLGKSAAGLLARQPGAAAGARASGFEPSLEGEEGGVGNLLSFEEEFLSGAARDREQVRAARSWEEFYAALRVLGLPPDEAEDLVLARLAEVFALTSARSQDLDRLFHEEQHAVTEDALRRHGKERLYRVLDLPKAERQKFIRGLSEDREAVRRRFDDAYLALVGPERLGELNQHLRSESIALIRFANDQSVAIGGVGLRELY